MPRRLADPDISPRDVVILKVCVESPTVSTCELSSILEAKYGISLSHNRIYEILPRTLRIDVFREMVLPDQEMFRHYLPYLLLLPQLRRQLGTVQLETRRGPARTDVLQR